MTDARRRSLGSSHEAAQHGDGDGEHARVGPTEGDSGRRKWRVANRCRCRTPRDDRAAGSSSRPTVSIGGSCRFGLKTSQPGAQTTHPAVPLVLGCPRHVSPMRPSEPIPPGNDRPAPIGSEHVPRPPIGSHPIHSLEKARVHEPRRPTGLPETPFRVCGECARSAHEPYPPMQTALGTTGPPENSAPRKQYLGDGHREAIRRGSKPSNRSVPRTGRQAPEPRDEETDSTPHWRLESMPKWKAMRPTTRVGSSLQRVEKGFSCSLRRLRPQLYKAVQSEWGACGH
jgi:hypothetical protein